MKIGFKLLAALFVAFLVTGCGSSSDDNGGGGDEPAMDGWMLAKMGGSSSVAGTVYLQLNSDNTFNLYQSIETPGYVKLTGTYSVTADSKGVQTLSGVYTGQKPWKNSYQIVSLSEYNMSLKNVAEDASKQVVYDYVGVLIPDYVKDGVTGAATSRAEEEVEGFL